MIQQLQQTKEKRKKRKKSKITKHGRNEVFQFTAQQSIDGDPQEQGSDKDTVSNDGSIGSTGDKRKKYKSVFQRAFQKIKANKQQGKTVDGIEQEEDGIQQPATLGSLPPGIPKLNHDVELPPPKVATYLLEETGDDLLMQNRRTSNEFYKVRKASLVSSMGSDLSPRSNNETLDDEEDEVVAEAILSARARGRRVSLGGWLDETPVTTPDSSRRTSLAAGTWMADLQLAKNQHLMQEALDKEVEKNKKSRKAKSGWKKAVNKVKRNRKRSKTCEDTRVEKLVDRISEEGSLHSSFNNSTRFSFRNGNIDESQDSVLTTWNNLTSEPVESGLTPGETAMYGVKKPAELDNKSLPSLRMGWIETKDSATSDQNTKDEGAAKSAKDKKKKKKAKKDKNQNKKANSLHRTVSSDVLDGVDPKKTREESSESESGLSKSMSAAVEKPKRKFSHVFKRAVSKMKKDGKTPDGETTSLETPSRQGSIHSLHSDFEHDWDQRLPGQGQRSRLALAVSTAGSSDLLGTLDLEALPSDDKGLYGLRLTPVPQKKRHSRTPSPQPSWSGSTSLRGGTGLDIGGTYSPRPSSMYGDEDEDDNEDICNDNDEKNSIQRESAYAHDRESIHSEIPVIKVKILFNGLPWLICQFYLHSNVTERNIGCLNFFLILYRCRIQMQILVFTLPSETPANHQMRAGPLLVVSTTSLVAAVTDQVTFSLQTDQAGASLHIPTLLCVWNLEEISERQVQITERRVTPKVRVWLPLVAEGEVGLSACSVGIVILEV